jgi:hypothetical protein
MKRLICYIPTIICFPQASLFDDSDITEMNEIFTKFGSSPIHLIKKGSFESIMDLLSMSVQTLLMCKGLESIVIRQGIQRMASPELGT